MIKWIKSLIEKVFGKKEKPTVLEDGNYAAQPNNRIIWDIPSFTVRDEIPDWKVQTSEWNVEDTRKWKTEDTDKYFYKIEEKKDV